MVAPTEKQRLRKKSRKRYVGRFAFQVIAFLLAQPCIPQILTNSPRHKFYWPNITAFSFLFRHLRASKILRFSFTNMQLVYKYYSCLHDLVLSLLALPSVDQFLLGHHQHRICLVVMLFYNAFRKATLLFPACSQIILTIHSYSPITLSLSTLSSAFFQCCRLFECLSLSMYTGSECVRRCQYSTDLTTYLISSQFIPLIICHI